MAKKIKKPAPAPTGGDTTVENTALAAPAPPVVFTGGPGTDIHSGGAGSDTLSGAGGRDILNGLGGGDILNGDDGNDKLNGGDGNDTLNGGLGADQLDGGAGDDTLNGGGDNDYLNGGLGNDNMAGGAGNDVYIVDSSGDIVTEGVAAGYDVVRSSVTFTLGINVEALELGAGAINGTGNAAANHLTGGAGANVLMGLGGADTIDGGGGNDTITGGAGNDLMTGGAGADTFVVLQESVYSSKAPAGKVIEVDFVFDLIKAQGDKLDLSAIDADTGTAGDQAFTLVTAFTDHAGQMTLAYNATSKITTLSLDTDGDGHPDYMMKITGDVHLDSGGWVL